MSKPVFRFAIVDDARCSLEWRVWSGSSSPTQELYIAPRSSSYPFKISVHSDGYCQLAFVAEERPPLRDTDRQALTRWQLPVLTEWVLAYQIVFPTDDLQPGNPSAPARSWPAAPPGMAACVAVYRNDGLDAQAPEADRGWIDSVKLPRATGEIFIGLTHRSISDDALLPSAGGHLWRLPEPIAHTNPCAHMFTTDEAMRCPTVIEYAKRHHPRANRIDVPHFLGIVRPWSSAPADLRADITRAVGDEHLCAVVEHRAGGRTKAILWIDEFSRCNLAAIGAKANYLLADASRADRKQGRVDIVRAAAPSNPLLTKRDHAIAATPGIGTVTDRIFDGETLRTLGRT